MSRPKSVLLDTIAVCHGLLALCSVLLAIADWGDLAVLLCPGTVAGAVAYGLWLRRMWSRALTIVVHGLLLVIPLYLLFLLLTWEGPPGIGYGFVVFFCIASLLTILPISGILLWWLSRTTSKSLFVNRK